MGKRKLITIFFDLEGTWGSPAIDRQALQTDMESIKEILNKSSVKAVFNTTGKIIEELPGLIKDLHRDKHEISVHGYLHENFLELNLKETTEILGKVEALIYEVIGFKPKGIRMPWLAYDVSIYLALKERGYKWTSNLCQYSTVELLDRPYALQSTFCKARSLRKFILSLKEGLMLHPKEPFLRMGLLEIPLLSVPDTQLFKEVYPYQNTSRRSLEYAYDVLRAQYKKSGEYFNLNFHPWLIASANRIELLDMILNYIKERNDGIFKLPSEIIGNQEWRK